MSSYAAGSYAWTKAGPCLVLEEEDAQVKILLPGRKRAKWVSKTHILPEPSKLRLIKRGVGFDQDCGCVPVVDLTPSKVVVYNIYGSYRKYHESNLNEGSVASAHHRRKQLAAQGYTRAKGKNFQTKDMGEEAYRFLKIGKGKKKYQIAMTV